jgi:hypothetical protein
MAVFEKAAKKQAEDEVYARSRFPTNPSPLQCSRRDVALIDAVWKGSGHWPAVSREWDSEGHPVVRGHQYSPSPDWLRRAPGKAVDLAMGSR